MKPSPLINEVTRRSAEAGRGLVWNGLATSAALHALALAAVLVFSLWNHGDIVDPVMPYPPEQDLASITIAPSQAAALEQRLDGALQFAPEAASPVEQALQAVNTSIERPMMTTELPAESVAAEPPEARQRDASAAAPTHLHRPAASPQSQDQQAEMLESLAAMGALSRASSGVDSRLTPRVLVNPAPQYPRDALARRLSGVVLLQVEVDAAGNVIDLQVLRSSGVESLDQSALEAVRRWQFLPARDPQTGPRKVNIPVEFVLRQGRR